MKKIFESDLVGFICYFRKKGSKTACYLISKDKSDDLVLIAKSSRFVVTFIVKKSGNSSLSLELRTEVSSLIQNSQLESFITSEHGYVYFVCSEYGYKIGCAKDYKSRVKSLGTIMPFDYDVTHVIECVNYQELERILHKAFESKRIKGEWFKIDNDDMKDVQKICDNYNARLIALNEEVEK